MLVGKSWQQTEIQVCIYIYIYAVVTGCTYYG